MDFDFLRIYNPIHEKININNLCIICNIDDDYDILITDDELFCKEFKKFYPKIHNYILIRDKINKDINKYKNIFLNISDENLINNYSSLDYNNVKQLIINFTNPIENINLQKKIAKSHWLVDLQPNNNFGISIINNIVIANKYKCTYIRKDIYKKLYLNTKSISNLLSENNSNKNIHSHSSEIYLTGYPYQNSNKNLVQLPNNLIKNNKKKIALQIFGQFRKYVKDLFEKNIYELHKILKDYDVDAFILSNKEDGSYYSLESEEYIKNILNKYNINVVFFKYWEELEEYHGGDVELYNDYQKFYNNSRKIYYPNKDQPKYVSINFGKQYYRKYILNKLFLETKQYKYDFVCAPRLFDTNIVIFKNFDFLNNYDGTLYFGITSFLIGSEEIVTKVFDFAINKNFVGDEIWDDINFSIQYGLFGVRILLLKESFADEVQLFYHIYKNIEKYQNIRVDTNNQNSPEAKKWYFYQDVDNRIYKDRENNK